MKWNEMADYLTSSQARGRPTSTAKSYHGAVGWLLKDQNIMSCRDMDIAKVIERLDTIKYRGQYIKHKNAIYHFCDFLGVKITPEAKQDIEQKQSTKPRQRRKPRNIKYTDIMNKVDNIRDKKLKLSFQTMLKTGLRVSELAQIRKSDCKIHDDYIEFEFIAKGGKKQGLQVLKNNSIYPSLLKHIKCMESESKIFYSAPYLQEEAHKRGFQCHDLRRAFAKVTYKNSGSTKETMKLLRHENLKTTKLYLKSAIEIDE